MLISSTHALTWTSHLISIGPDRACLEVSEPPPSCAPISHTSGTISKEQAPFRPDCPLSCLPTHGPQRIGFRLRLGHSSLSNHVRREAWFLTGVSAPSRRAVTALRLQQGLCLHHRGAQGLDQAATRENALSSPSPFGRCWAFLLTIHRPAPGRAVCCSTTGHANCFKGGANHATQRSTCSTTHALRSEARTANCAFPHTGASETFLLRGPTAMRDLHLQPQ